LFVRRDLANNRTGRRSRRGSYMAQAGAAKHAMKMGVRRKCTARWRFFETSSRS